MKGFFDHWRRHPLTYRMVAYIVVGSVGITLVSTAAQLYWQYRSDVATLDRTLDLIAAADLESLTASQWVLDETLTRAQVQGIAGIPHMWSVTVVPEEGEPIRAGRPGLGDGPFRRAPMIYEASGEPVRIGTLELSTTLTTVRARLFQQLPVILATQAFNIFLVALLILLIVQYLMTRHLHAVAEYAARLEVGEIGEPLVLDRRPPPVADELDLVVAALHDMRARLNADLSALKEGEQRRRELIADLEAKNTELERFSFAVSHDLKSPLITIRGFLDFMEQDLQHGDVGTLKEDLRRLRSTTEKMQDLLDDMLALSQAGRLVGERREVALAEVAREAAELLSGQVSDHGIALEIDDDLPVVFGDPARLRQVFQNLIGNGIKFMGEQPAPSLRVEHLPCDEEKDCGCVAVRDNGIGIESDHLDRIFGLFERVDRSVEGTGIGLALAQRIIEAHGGRIWVESGGEGHGSSFCFSLPKSGS